jgi:glutathione S-transferase
MALAHKGIEVESVNIDPADRSPLERISGQRLVPVLDIDGEVIADSMTIVRRLEDRFPQEPLYPGDPARRAEMELFIDWFNRVWKRPPNAMEAELGKPQPDQAKINVWRAEMKGHLSFFEQLLQGREYLFGETFSAADCCAWPFLRYAVFEDENDEYLFHRILVDNMRLEGRYPRLEAWIRRLRDRPQA